MCLANRKHDWVWPLSAALHIHCAAFCLLRVTPRPRAWQIMLATSCDALDLKGVQNEEGACIICQALPRPTVY